MRLDDIERIQLQWKVAFGAGRLVYAAASDLIAEINPVGRGLSSAICFLAFAPAWFLLVVLPARFQD